MNRKPYRVPDYLTHILQAISKIDRYTAGLDQPAFLQDELTQDAVVRNFEIIGEACRNIMQRDPNFSATHPLLPLISAYEVRNFLAHGYADVDASVVWLAIQEDLPALKQQVTELLH